MRLRGFVLILACVPLISADAEDEVREAYRALSEATNRALSSRADDDWRAAAARASAFDEVVSKGAWDDAGRATLAQAKARTIPLPAQHEWKRSFPVPPPSSRSC